MTKVNFVITVLQFSLIYLFIIINQHNLAKSRSCFQITMCFTCFIEGKNSVINYRPQLTRVSNLSNFGQNIAIMSTPDSAYERIHGINNMQRQALEIHQ